MNIAANICLIFGHENKNHEIVFWNNDRRKKTQETRGKLFVFRVFWHDLIAHIEPYVRLNFNYYVNSASSVE